MGHLLACLQMELHRLGAVAGSRGGHEDCAPGSLLSSATVRLLQCGAAPAATSPAPPHSFGRYLRRSVTPYEKLEILHIAYYGYMQGCNIIADATYVDIQAMNNMLLQGLAQRQGELIRAVREMQIAVEALSVRNLLRVGQVCAHPHHPRACMAASFQKRGGGSGSSSGAKLDTVTPDALRRRKKRTDNGPGMRCLLPPCVHIDTRRSPCYSPPPRLCG